MEITKDQIEHVGIDTITPYEKNARDNDKAVDAVAESIEQFGFRSPIIVDEDGVIIAGHTRLKAAQKLGLTTVPIVRAVELTKQQARAYRLADNKVGEIATWDKDLLAEELSALDDEFHMHDFGFDENDMLGAFDDKEAEDDGFDGDEELPKHSRAKEGDVFLLGKHRVMCGDTTDPDDFEKLMAGAEADCLVTDPPYNVAYEGKTKDALTIANDDMTDDAFLEFLRHSFDNLARHLKPGGGVYVFYSGTEALRFHQAFVDAGLLLKQILIWIKNSLVMGRQDYQWKHEPLMFGWKQHDEILHGWKAGDAHRWYGGHSQTTVLEWDRPTRSLHHPTMKPVGLVGTLIKNSTRPGDIVLDGFAGSGSTLIACEQTDRTCYAMEKDPAYVEVVLRRWEEHTGRKAQLIEA